jgi:1-acyl-sn-glycerol-3-phosphate acyltransferase
LPRFIVMSKLSPTGTKRLRDGDDQLASLRAEVEKIGGKVVEQYALLGSHDFCTIVEVRDNDAAFKFRVAERGGEDTARSVLPAIDLSLFIRLLGQSTENTGPHRWQITPPARAVRWLMRSRTYEGDAKRYFKPLTVIGADHFDDLRGPAIFVANHSSFMDAAALYAAVPKHYQRRVAWPAAADRFFIKGRRDFRKQGWYFSLVYNSFPMKRGGGRSSLDHADWLIGKGWSIAIFPEGARTSGAKLARFKMGPAILATRHGIPVMPMYLEGLAAVRAKGSREKVASPVTVRVGRPLSFPGGTDPAEANRELYRAVETLAQEAAAERRAQRRSEAEAREPQPQA